MSTTRDKALEGLLNLSPELLGQGDIAEMNLLCAIGIPGTEDLDIRRCLATLDDWARRVRVLTEKYVGFFQERSAEFENSEPLWRVCCVARALSRECGVRYAPEEQDNNLPADWRESSRHFISGLLGEKRHGTCASFPVLLVAIGRRLGYPMRLVESPGHLFSRWDALDHPNRAWRERRNFEFTGDIDSFPDEHYYHRPLEWTAETHAQERLRQIPLYLRSLTPSEELATFLIQRATALEAHEMWTAAMSAYVAACRLSPRDDRYVFFARECHRHWLDAALKPWGFTGKWYCQLLAFRQSGSAVSFPWETPDGQLIPVRNPFANPNMGAALLLAERAVAARYGSRAPTPELIYTPSVSGLNPSHHFGGHRVMALVTSPFASQSLSQALPGTPIAGQQPQNCWEVASASHRPRPIR